jgi:hypothetical protein
MALFAIASQLAAVKIGMTIGALIPDILKNKFGMALSAINSRMHATKAKTSLRMLKIREGPDWLKTRGCVAGSASNSDRSMRSTGISGFLVSSSSLSLFSAMHFMALGAYITIGVSSHEGMS